MIIHPDLRALRSDDAPQRNAQEALFRAVSTWREQPHVAALFSEIDRFDGCQPIMEFPQLSTLFCEGHAAARSIALQFTRLTSECLGHAPLGHAPFRHFTDGVHSTLLLARSGNVTLSLVCVDGEGFNTRPAPTTADFSPSEVWEHVLAGSARAAQITCHAADENAAQLDQSEISLAARTIVRRNARQEAMQLRQVEGCLVTLRLQRRQVNAGPTREYRLADGALVHQAAGNPMDSRAELMMALLGRMKRGDAAPLLAEIALGDAAAALRWQALRECLALDTFEGFSALTAIARSPDDLLASTAGALRSQLIETYPQLREVETCPA